MLAAAAVSPAFEDLMSTIPDFQTSERSAVAADFDWALHPGGSTIITGVQKAMNITEENLRASYEIYMNYGNSSSATIMAVMSHLRHLPGGKDNVVACAFGPGISLEMMVLRRRRAQANGHSQVHEHIDINRHPVINRPSQANGHSPTNPHHQANGNIHENGLDKNNEMNGLPAEEVD